MTMTTTTITNNNNNNNNNNNVFDNDNDNVDCEQSHVCFKILRKGMRVAREASSAGARTSEKRDCTLTVRINDTLPPTPKLKTILALIHRVVITC